MNFTREQLNQIKDKIDYLEFYKKYLPELTQKGKYFWSSCVWHSDRKPSLQVDIETGCFRCWSCNTYGDIFTFYQKFFCTSFTEAVQAIAEMYSIELEVSDEEKLLYERRKSLYNVNNVINNKFIKNLYDNTEAWNYLTQIRGFSPKIIRDFKLGVGMKLLPEKESLKQLNLIKNSDKLNGWKPTMGDYRITIPRIDTNGNIVSFTGRDFKDIPNAPKYLHLPNTEIYEKSKYIFGLYQAKKYIKQFNSVILVEGNFDLIKCHQKGVVNAVALDGLNISDEQVNLLKKYTNTFYICVEDEAWFRRGNNGVTPLGRLHDTILENIPYAKIYVVDLRNPDGTKCDPDDFLSTHERKEFKDLILNAKIYNEYIINLDLKGVNPKNIEEKTSCINFLIPKIASIQNFLTRKQYIELVSNKLLIPENDIFKKIKNYIERKEKLDTENITWDSRPVFAQKILLSICFAPNFNNVVATQKVSFMAKDYMEPFYRNILKDIIEPYILKHKNFNELFSDIMYNDNVSEVTRKTLLDIYLKVEQLEDFEPDDLEYLIQEQIETLEEYSYSEGTVDNLDELAGVDV